MNTFIHEIKESPLSGQRVTDLSGCEAAVRVGYSKSPLSGSRTLTVEGRG